MPVIQERIKPTVHVRCAEDTPPEVLRQLQSGHQQILEAICARDVKTATSMLEDHLTGLMDGFIRGVQS